MVDLERSINSVGRHNKTNSFESMKMLIQCKLMVLKLLKVKMI